jgi:hypothetical protein
MKKSALLGLLHRFPDSHLQFVLPDGGKIPIHAHITEVGRVDKTFLDCGATVRRASSLCLQSWVAGDVDHRLAAGKLAEIIDRAAPVLGTEDLDVELEYEDGLISQFPLEEAQDEGKLLAIRLGVKHTDCLAKDVCLPLPTADQGGNSCCPGTGCC